jgi:alcohol dehydrogenase YqhD (iron-dependent ADH family)
MRMFDFEFYNPVRAIFGIGKVDVAGEEAAKLGTKAILVSYKELGPLADLLGRVKGLLSEAGVEVVEFFAFEENPAIETVADGVALAKQEGCDMVVAVGGGSVMDGGKAVAAGVCYEGDLWNMVNSRHDGSSADIAAPEKALRLMTIPTLPATGSDSRPPAAR